MTKLLKYPNVIQRLLNTSIRSFLDKIKCSEIQNHDISYLYEHGRHKWVFRVRDWHGKEYWIAADCHVKFLEHDNVKLVTDAFNELFPQILLEMERELDEHVPQ